MTVFKCKMCGGTLEIQDGVKVAVCKYCDIKQTLPDSNDEVVINLFNRANNLRIKCDFDKAHEIYEKIINNGKNDPEAYWGMVLCKYGIEYVEDPASFKRVPTCHRTQIESVLTDIDYRSAIEYADVSQKAIYEAEAQSIDALQKDILAISSKEEPFDVFICYKQTDENSMRTKDSVIANDIYHQLTQEGFKVFCAAITLEDKLGKEYEPYIFAALNSAKVMLVVGSKPEYFNAVWVKNEWSRYLKLIQKDRSKLLIPCYRDMDAYDLPDEFSHLQAQDMGKIGFINDVVRAIKKILNDAHPKETVKETVVMESASSANVDSLLKRAFMFIEDADWASAMEYCEKVLDINPECADAYYVKLLATNKVGSIDSYLSKLESKYTSVTSETLYACKEDVDHIRLIVKENAMKDYLKADAIKRLYIFDRSYSSALSCCKEQKRRLQAEIDNDKLLARVRLHATGELKDQLESGLAKLVTVFDARIAEQQQADEAKIVEITASYRAHIEETDKKIKEKRVRVEKAKHNHYESIVADMNNATTVSAYEKARDKFKALGKYENSIEFANKCQSEIERIIDDEYRKNARVVKRNNIIALITIAISVILAIMLIVYAVSR